MATVLVVEDSHAQAVALKQTLQADGHKVEIASGGREGIKMALSKPFDLILSDILMPDLDGYHVCRRIKSEPQTKHVPVILLTTLRDVTDVLRGLECGADNFITKPYDEDYLCGRVREILSASNNGQGEDDTEPVETVFGGQSFTISSSKQRILEYLLTTNTDFIRAKEREHESRLAEGTLRESLRFLQSTLDALSARIAILDEYGVIAAVNWVWRASVASSDLLGTKFDVGTNYLEVCDEASRNKIQGAAQIAAGIRSVMAERRKEFRIEYRVANPNEERWFVVRVTRFMADVRARVVVAYTELTDRKRAEAALQQNQRTLSTLMRNLPGMAYRCNVEEPWTMRFVSEGCVELTGYQPADLLHNSTVPYSKLIHPDDHDWVRYARHAAIRQGIPFRFVYRIWTAGGREKWVWEQGRGVVDNSGKMVGLEGIVTDITQRKLAETAMVEEGHISAALARVGEEMISAVNKPVLLDRLCELSTEALSCDFTHTWLHQQEDDTFALVSGYGDTPEQWESGRLVRIPRSSLTEHLNILKRDEVFQDLAPQSGHGPLARFASEFGTTSCLCVALRRGEEITGFLASGYRGRTEPFDSIQERTIRGLAHLASMALETARLVEQLEHANRFKSDFLAAMSHELRTPLNVIIGYNSLLIEEAFGALNPGQLDTSQRIDKNARELLELVSATLDLTRFDARRVPITALELDVHDLVDEVSRETGPLLQKPGVEVHWKIGGDLPVLYSDPLKVRMVLKNLIGNAIKFTEEGSIEVTVEPREGGVQFTISDTGIGISPIDLSLIFEPFQQAHGAISQRYGGAGLGLYLVRRIVDMLQGWIKVESDFGVGSTFRVWLPEKTVDDESAEDIPLTK